MKTARRVMRVVLLVSFVQVLLSCGGGTGISPNKAEPIVSVSLTEHNLTVSGGETHQFAARVSGSSNPNIIWSLSCTDDTCGAISPSGLYTGPSRISSKHWVWVTAASEADSNKTDHATVQLMPIAVSISTMDTWVVLGGTQEFTASVLYDTHHAGVTWALGSTCGNNCGTLSNVTPTSVTYTAPVTAPDSFLTKLTASSVSDPNQKVEMPIMLAAAGGLTEGDYAFVFNGWEAPISEPWDILYEIIAAGRFHADAQGNISQGVEDINSFSGVVKALPFTGNYMIGADGRGSFTFITAQGNATYRMVLDASRKSGKFIRFDPLEPDFAAIRGSGYFELQDKAAFSLAALAGPYAFGLSGTLEVNRLDAVGRFDADASGTFAGGSADMTQQLHGGNDLQVSSTNLKLSGLLGTPSASTGRGTATLNWGSSYNFAYYIISDQKILLVQIDTRDSTTPVLSGQFQRQKGAFSLASFSGPAIFSKTGADRVPGFFAGSAVGQIIPDGAGSFTGTYDDNGLVSDEPITGSYTIDSNGRSELQMKHVAGNIDTDVAYFFASNKAFLMQTSGYDVLFGRLRPQTAGPFSEASLNGAYLSNTSPPATAQAETDIGLTTFDGSGGITSTIDVYVGKLYHVNFDGTYTVVPNGRGTLTFSSVTGVFWVISPTEIVGLGAITADTLSLGTLLEYEKQEVAASTDVR